MVKVKGFPAKWIFLFVLSVYLLTIGKGYYSTDGEVMLKLAWALAEHGKIGFPCEERLPNAPPGRNGLCYSKYGLGQSLSLLPFYLIGRNLCFLFSKGNPVIMGKWFADRANSLFTALTAVLVGLWAFKLFSNLEVAVALSLIYSLATMAWPYAKFNFNQPLITLCLTGGFYALWNYKRKLSMALLSGVAFGWGFLTRISDIIVLPWALLLWAYLRGQNLHFWAWSTIILIAVALTVGYNLYAFGNPMGGYLGEKWSTPLFVGLYGLLMSSGKSLFLFVPIAFLFPQALTRFFKSGKRLEAVICGGLLATYLVFYASFWTWHGGWSWGPRFLVPTMPFLVLPLGALWADRKFVILLVAAISLIIQFLGVTINFADYMLEVNDETKILFIPQYSPILGHFYGLLHLKWPIDLAPVDLSPFGLGKGYSISLLMIYLLLLVWSSERILKALK